MTPTWHIEPLSTSTLAQAVKFVDKMFPDEGFKPSRAFKASLDPEKSGDLWEDEAEMRYWVALDLNGRVIGTTGTYASIYEYKDGIRWLGWFSVAPDCRKRGIGQALLTHMEDYWKASGGKRALLYTTPESDVDAQPFYEKRGYKVYLEQTDDKGQLTFYREKPLT